MRKFPPTLAYNDNDVDCYHTFVRCTVPYHNKLLCGHHELSAVIENAAGIQLFPVFIVRSIDRIFICVHGHNITNLTQVAIYMLVDLGEAPILLLPVVHRRIRLNNRSRHMSWIHVSNYTMM